MTKADWETKHHYMKSEHSCGFCKHCEAEEKDPWTIKCRCNKKREAGAGSETKSSYCCDLWEHRYKN
jgi:hypothetical protein